MKRGVKQMGRRFGLGLTAIIVLQHAQAQTNTVEKQFSYTAADLVDRLATIECRNANGTVKGGAVIVNFEGKPYLVTNQRFIYGADRIELTAHDGRPIRPRSIELAQSRDLVRMALAEGEGLELSGDFSKDAAVAVFQNPNQKSGALFGSITGVGADIIEVNADFTEAHSGNPALNSAQEIIGIASHISEPHSSDTKKGTRFESRTRRFCYRLDHVQWRPVNWRKFNGKFGEAYLEGHAFSNQIIDILTRWHDEPLKPVTLDQSANELADWNDTHSRIVLSLNHNKRFDRKLQSQYSESTESLAETCRSKAAKIRMIAEQRGLTDFLLKEFEIQAGTLEAAADIIDRYSTLSFY